jgi:hypothetical protein
MALNLEHQTPAEFADRLRERYRNSTQLECARIAAWLYDHYQAGDFTAGQLRLAFGMDANQFSIFVAKVLLLRDHYLAILAAEGE